jgi:hypothetical protein
VKGGRRRISGPLVTGLTFLAGAMAAGCGDDPAPPAVTTTAEAPAPPASLTSQEQRLLTAYDRRINAHCVRVSTAIADPSAAPTPAQRKRAFEAADALVDLAAAKPDAPLGAGQDARLFLADVIENLEGSNCDPAMIARLEQGLAEIPAG